VPRDTGQQDVKQQQRQQHDDDGDGGGKHNSDKDDGDDGDDDARQGCCTRDVHSVRLRYRRVPLLRLLRASSLLYPTNVRNAARKDNTRRSASSTATLARCNDDDAAAMITTTLRPSRGSQVNRCTD